MQAQYTLGNSFLDNPYKCISFPFYLGGKIYIYIDDSSTLFHFINGSEPQVISINLN